MRLIGTIHQIREAETFCHFLTQQGITNQLDVVANSDWGSPNYGDRECRIWITEEDQVDEAVRLYEYFHEHPEDPRFKVSKKTLAEEVIRPFKETPKDQESTININDNMKTAEKSQKALGPVTLWIFMICCLLFFVSQQETPKVTNNFPSNIPLSPIFTSPIKKDLLFDYPQAYEIVDKLVKSVGIPALESGDPLPPEAEKLIAQLNNTPYFHGLYDGIIDHFNHGVAGWGFDAPLFEKIKEGEIWRLFTPTLLHADIFHLLFNMLWLIAIGRQMEQRLNWPRYVIFIFITGIGSNIAQYLMSGSNFVGFSGVLVGMLTFVWIRQKTAPWEGYLLQKSTMAFVSLFVLGMFLIQLASFILEITTKTSLSAGIANTAHLVGGALGLILGRLKYFSWKKL